MRSAWARRLLEAAVFLVFLPQTAFADGPASVAKLATALSPAVVNISSSRTVGGSGVPFPGAPKGSPLGQLFDDVNPNGGLGPNAEQEAKSLGSGFIINADGTIVTNNHVIDGATDIQVFLTDGTRLAAKLVGADDKADLAVLKVEAGHPLPFVEFGDSDTAQVGDWVMAIGNPFGLGGSVTLGIVSARNRDIQEGPYDDFIQTDAAINQGNSGGPLFDMNGKVVGINTAIIARGGSSLGIGFAVPVNLAHPVIEQLAAYGETRRGWLGAGVKEVTPEIAASLGRPNQNGALVVDVAKSGPAGGILLEGDIILEFNGRPIEKLKDLSRFVALTGVGQKVPIRLLRAGNETTVEVTLGRLETGSPAIATLKSADVAPGNRAAPAARALKDAVGFDLAAIDDAARKTYAIGSAVTGLVITEVVKGSDAERQGLSAGTVVTEINQLKVTSVSELTSQVNAAELAGRPAVLFKVIDPSGATRFLAIKLN